MRGVTWRPAGRRRAVLNGLDFDVAPGEQILLTGPSGSGKSTVLRALAGVLTTAQVGDLTGVVEVTGRVGYLPQDPTSGAVAPTIGRDIAFGPENIGLPRAEIWRRVHEALELVGLSYPIDHPTTALSGGQRQLLALAGVLSLRPSLLLLDEPTSMLDDGAASRVRAVIQRVARHISAAVVVVEHRLDGWVDHADRLVVLDAAGNVSANDCPARVLVGSTAGLLAAGVWVPGQGRPARKPLPGKEFCISESTYRTVPLVPAGSDAMVAHNVVFRYPRSPWSSARHGARSSETPALSGHHATLTGGQLTVVTGTSGAGKSTMVALWAGLARPQAGSVIAHPVLAARAERRPWRWRSVPLARRVAWVPQFPEQTFVTRTVRDELLATSRAIKIPLAVALPKAEMLAEVLGLDHVWELDPYRLSGGQQRRLALAAGVVHCPAIVLADEPTTGQDRLTWAAMVSVLQAMADVGVAVGVATHDPFLGDLADHRVAICPPAGGSE
ncbi:MAG: ATP-binding cassette domain-containing protein [Actinomycetota bacterium]